MRQDALERANARREQPLERLAKAAGWLPRAKVKEARAKKKLMAGELKALKLALKAMKAHEREVMADVYADRAAKRYAGKVKNPGVGRGGARKGAGRAKGSKNKPKENDDA